MKEFIARNGEQIDGVISGFDRLVFRAHLRSITYSEGMKKYLSINGVLLKDFAGHALGVTDRLKEAALSAAKTLGRPVKYLPSSQISKEEMARSIAAEDSISSGLVCVLTCVEPCWSFDIYRNRETKKLDLIPRRRKCLFLYHYWIHPVFGFMNARIQSWFPFPVQICLNGREWLGRQMEAEGLQYVRQDNCFPWIEDYARAQQLLEGQLEVNWPEMLGGVARQLNPIHEEIFDRFRVDYYWSTYQSEWATDLVFRHEAVLKRLYPKLVHHGMTTFGSADVMRFLGRRVRLDGHVPKWFAGELASDLKRREEGVRVKHSMNGNSLKIYDKAFTVVGNVLRAEATINQVDDFRVYRPKEGDPEGNLAWRVMRRGVADLHRRAQISQKANERYLDALASVDESATVEELSWRLEQPTKWNGQRVRALRLLDPEDGALLKAISRAEFALNGLRNRDLRRLLFDTSPGSKQEARRRSAQTSRKLRLLRAHGLLQKVPHTHRYQVSSTGRKALTAILTARQATVAQLTAKAA